MVVYIGLFCKPLAPGFRSGYLVAPENLIAELSKLRGIVDRHGDTLMEQALSELLEEGEIQRHMEKALKVYHERRDMFCNLLSTKLSDFVSFSAPPGGLAIWTTWDPNFFLMRISKDCAIQNLHLPQKILYKMDCLIAMRLGFGSCLLKNPFRFGSN